MKKILLESTGVNLESKMPPLIEFMGPGVIQVQAACLCGERVITSSLCVNLL